MKTYQVPNVVILKKQPDLDQSPLFPLIYRTKKLHRQCFQCATTHCNEAVRNDQVNEEHNHHSVDAIICRNVTRHNWKENSRQRSG